MEHEVQTKDKSLPLYIALLVAIFVTVLGLFALLKGMAPTSWEAQIWDEMTVEKTTEGTYQMRMLDERERNEKIVRTWLEQAGDEEDACWLYVQEEDYYVLYLPGQDRVLGLQDLTVAEEADVNGEVTLVIRGRTAEGSEQIPPEEQLFAIKTNSSVWRGIRVSVILDGREKDVRKLVVKDGTFFSTEEVYIGRF